MAKWILTRLAILAVVLIASGLWIAVSDPGKSGSPPQRSGDPRPRGAQQTGDFWGRPETLDDHFRRHGADFQARDAADYARQAHAHLLRAYSVGLPAKRDSEGVLRIFDWRTGAFGAYNADGTTRTFFKPGSPGYFERQPGERVDLHRPLRL